MAVIQRYIFLKYAIKSDLPAAPDLCWASEKFNVLKVDRTVAQVQGAVVLVPCAVTCSIMLFLWDVKWDE